MIDFPDPLPVRVDFAFGADPDVTPDEGQWTTVPDDHWISQSIAISRGRQNEEDQVQAASWSFQLLNDSGNYTPDLVTSPHYPHLKLGLPCRIRVGSMVRAVGNVAEITPEWPAGDIDPGHSLVRVTVGGFLRRLGQGELPANSALFRAISRRSDVIAYWPCEDESGSGQAASPLPGVSPITSGLADFASADGPPGSGSLPQLREGGENFLGPVPQHPAAESYTCLLVWQIDELAATGRRIMSVQTSSAQIPRWQLSVSEDELIMRGSVTADAGGGTVFSATTPISPLWPVGGWVLAVVTLEQVLEDLDWSAVVMLPAPGLPVLNALSGTQNSTALGRLIRVGPIDVESVQDRYAGHITALRGVVDPAGFDAVHGFTGERAADRFERLCQEEGPTCTVIGTAADSMPMGPQRPATFIQHLQEIADTDGGILAEVREAFGFEYRTRASMYNQDPALELDAGTFPGDITHPFVPTLDDQQIRNDVTAQQAGGSSARVVDLADIDDRGHFAGDLTVNVHGDARLSLVASWRLHHGTHPGMRYPSISPALTQEPDLISGWVTLELGDRIRAFGLPDEHPVDDVDLLMQGYVETLEPHSWHVEANASPARPWNVFELEHATFGRLWSPRAYLGEDINTSATAFDVIVPVQRALNPVPGFESPITTDASFVRADWGVFGATLARSTEQAFVGRWSGKITPDGVNIPNVNTSTGAGTVGPAGVYRGSVWVYSPAGGFDVRLELVPVDINWGGLGPCFVAGSDITIPAGQWTRLTLDGSAACQGSSAMFFRIQYRNVGSAADPSDVLFIDNAEVGRPDAPFEVDTGLSTEVIIGGERMTVTAIGADDGTGAQTFTVTRSVNGVAKSHAAGSPVRLWPGHVMGL